MGIAQRMVRNVSCIQARLVPRITDIESMHRCGFRQENASTPSGHSKSKRTPKHCARAVDMLKMSLHAGRSLMCAEVSPRLVWLDLGSLVMRLQANPS